MAIGFNNIPCNGTQCWQILSNMMLDVYNKNFRNLNYSAIFVFGKKGCVCGREL